MSCSCPHPSHFNIKTTIAVDADTLPFGATHTAFLADGRSVSYTMTSDGTLFETLNKSLDKKNGSFYPNAADDAAVEERLSYAILLYTC